MNKFHKVVWTDEKVKFFWDVQGNFELNDFFAYNAGGEVLKVVSNQMRLRNKLVLDYGSGPGHLIPHLQKYKVKKYFALDFSEECLKVLKKKYSKRINFGGSFLGISESFKGKTYNDYFDVVLSLETIEHLNDEHLDSMMSEIKRVLKKDGIVVLTTPNKEDLNHPSVSVVCPDCGCNFHRVQHMRSWSLPSIESYMKKNGFQTIRIIETNLKYKWLNKIKNIIKWVIGKKVERKNLIYVGKRIAED